MVTPLNDPGERITVIGGHQPPDLPPRRFPWLLVAALAGTAAVFGVITSGAFDRTARPAEASPTTVLEDLVAGAEPDPTTTTTTTTTTLPPTLAERAPALDTASLRIAVSEVRDVLSIKVWEPTEREPATIEIAGAADGARFNSSGSWVGVAAGDQVRLVGLDSPGFMTLSDLFSVAWHESDPDLIAGTVTDDTGLAVAVWHVDEGLQRRFGPIDTFGDTGVRPRLAAWGDWGFAIQEPISTDPVVFLTSILNPDGEVIARAAAGVASTSSGLIAAVSFSDAAADAGIELPPGSVDLPPGVLVTTTSFVPIDPQPRLPDADSIQRIVLSPDGVWVAVAYRVGNDSGGSYDRIEISRLSGVGARTILPFDGDIVLGGFTGSSDFLLVHQPLAAFASVQIINYRTGASWSVPIEGERIRIIDVIDGQ